jgi:hypothetical protein
MHLRALVLALGLGLLAGPVAADVIESEPEAPAAPTRRAEPEPYPPRLEAAPAAEPAPVFQAGDDGAPSLDEISRKLDNPLSDPG